MRVSDNMRFHAVNHSLSSLGSRQLEATRQASTGQRIGAPSMDPIAAAEITRLESALARTKSYRDTVTMARGDLELAEGTLDEAGTLYQRVRELALLGANGTYDDAERETFADEVAQLKEQLVSLANTKGKNGYLFAGTSTDTTPFSATGVFSGNDGAQRVEVNAGATMRTNVSGAQTFTASGGVDVFATLDALETALRANDPTAVAATLGDIDRASAQLVSGRTDAGLLLTRLDTADAALNHTELVLTARKSDLGDADALEAFSELSSVTTSIEQAIAVARTTLNTDLNRFR